VARQGALERDRSETRHNLPINFISLARAYKFTCMRIQTGVKKGNLASSGKIGVIGGRRRDGVRAANGISNSSSKSRMIALRGYAPPRRHVGQCERGGSCVVGGAFCRWGNGSSGFGAISRFTANLGTSMGDVDKLSGSEVRKVIIVSMAKVVVELGVGGNNGRE